MTDRKRFLKYLIPSVLSMIVVSAYSFTDTFVVGRALGASGLAAIGIAIARVKEYDRCTDEEARQKILASDAARARYHEHYVHTAWGMANEYDLTINSTIGYDEAAAMIVKVFRSVAGEQRNP
ncbi:MAG: cytidylate kinase family protein [Eubacteriales bacterium]|nr:cytidylate kinase family protein [Eubacteriales bacterium]